MDLGNEAMNTDLSQPTRARSRPSSARSVHRDNESASFNFTEVNHYGPAYYGNHFEPREQSRGTSSRQALQRHQIPKASARAQSFQASSRYKSRRRRGQNIKERLHRSARHYRKDRK